MVISALFVQSNGVYFGLPEVDAWDEDRDARKYDGPYPVVAHPPCQRWGKLSRVNFARWGGDHNRPGNDGGCFESAIASVRKWGGVLEHPSGSYAWEKFGLEKPKFGVWVASGDGFVTEVWQAAYGHKARKSTWLHANGFDPPPLIWEKAEYTHQVGFFDSRGKDRNRPTLSRKEASKTPIPFRDLLISMARMAERKV
jgi:hypothetical protein